MSMLGFRKRTKAEGEQEFELNLASIIDCFTVLITYLLVSASFISLGVIDVSVSSATVTAVDETSKGATLDISIDVDSHKMFKVKLSGEATNSINIPAKDGTWDYRTLEGYLKGVREKFPTADYASVSADNSLEYKDLVKTVEVARSVIPTVSLGDRE